MLNHSRLLKFSSALHYAIPHHCIGVLGPRNYYMRHLKKKNIVFFVLIKSKVPKTPLLPQVDGWWRRHLDFPAKRCDIINFHKVCFVLCSSWLVKRRYIVICGGHRPNIWIFRKSHRDNVARLRKTHFEIGDIMGREFGAKFKSDTSTSTLFSNNDFMLEKLTTLVFAEYSLSI